MTQIPERIKYEIDCTDRNMAIVAAIKHTINFIIDYLHHRAELEDQRYKELTSRIDAIAGNQLEMKRDRDTAQKLDGFVLEAIKDQPKRWRAEKYGEYWCLLGGSAICRATDLRDVHDNIRYSIGNYHPTREAAEAYKARLLELGKEI